MQEMASRGLLQLLENAQKCSTGCAVLDGRLGGGIACKSITEIISEAGIGKSQICLQIALQANLNPERGGLGGCCVFFQADGNFPVNRLVEMANSQSVLGTEVVPTDTVFVQSVSSIEELMLQLSRTEVIIEAGEGLPVRMIIIDSVASLVRSQFRYPTDMARRTALLLRLGRRLKDLAMRYNLAVITTNQVRDYFNDRDTGDGGLGYGYLPELFTSGRRVLPALGRCWGRCPETRLFLSRLRKVTRDGAGRPLGYEDCRRLHVLRGPHLRRATVDFLITRDGVRGLSDI